MLRRIHPEDVVAPLTRAVMIKAPVATDPVSALRRTTDVDPF
jgi:hypothetical protein